MAIAVLIAVLIFYLPILFKELRHNKSIFLTYFFVIVLHQTVAVINAFWFTTIGADADATSFNQAGFELAQSGIFSFSVGSKFYENMLGVLYWVFGSSHFLGEQLSIFAFAISCIVLIKILRQLDLSQYQVPVLIVFGAIPTMVLLGSITMRESYQVLFFMMTVYFGIKMHLKGGLNRNLFFLMLSALMMGLFHKGLLVYMLVLIAVLCYFSLKPKLKFLQVKKLRVMLLGMSVIFVMSCSAMVSLQVSGYEVLSSLTNMDLINYAERYRDNAVIARATYGVSLDVSSIFSFITSSFVLYFYYLFAPFPWNVTTAVDVYASIEAFVRLILLYCSIKHWRSAYGVQRRLLGLLLILFFSMSFLWAMGTTNYGTAIRHHMLTWWILVVMGVPVLVDEVRRLYFRCIVRKTSTVDLVGNNP